MSKLGEKVAYLKGLAEGLRLDSDTDQGKLLLAMIDAMDAFAAEAEEQEAELAELREYVEEIDSDVGDLDVKTAHYARVRKLIEAFKAEHGTIVCRELLGALGELKKNPSARTAEYYKVRPCVLFVETAARLLDSMAQAESK